MNRNKLLLLIVIVLAVIAFFFFDLHQYFTLEAFKAQRQGLVVAQPIICSAERRVANRHAHWPPAQNLARSVTP